MNGIAPLSRRIAGAMLLAIGLVGCANPPSGPSPELAQQIETAKTPEDHLALAAHYEREAAAARSIAASHEKLSRGYQANPYQKGGASIRAHCLSLVKTYQSAAVQYDAMAQEHRQMAQRAQP